MARRGTGKKESAEDIVDDIGMSILYEIFREEGREIGMGMGFRHAARESALRMLRKGLKPEDVAEYAALSREEVLRLASRKSEDLPAKKTKKAR